MLALPKRARNKPSVIATLPKGSRLGQYMGNLNVTIQALTLNGVAPSYGEAIVRHALAHSPYETNGRYGTLTFGEDSSIRDGIHNLSSGGTSVSAFFKTYRCAKDRICNYQTRVPLNAQPGVTPAIIFGEHKHQLFENIDYNLDNGLTHELTRLVQIVLDLSLHGIAPKQLFRQGSDHFMQITNDQQAVELLHEFSEFEALYLTFIHSEFYETGTSTAYLYFHKDVIPTSPLMFKLFGVRYGGRRTDSLVNRLTDIRSKLKDCAVYLNACGSLEFLTLEVVTKVSAKTASIYEQLLLSNFVAKSNDRPIQQLTNALLVTGCDYRVFEESVDERKLAAYVILDALVSNDSKKREHDGDFSIEQQRWFPVSLIPRTSCYANSPVDEAMLYVIRHCAKILEAGLNWRNYTVDAATNRIEELEDELATIRLQN